VTLTFDLKVKLLTKFSARFCWNPQRKRWKSCSIDELKTTKHRRLTQPLRSAGPRASAGPWARACVRTINLSRAAHRYIKLPSITLSWQNIVSRSFRVPYATRTVLPVATCRQAKGLHTRAGWAWSWRVATCGHGLHRSSFYYRPRCDRGTVSVCCSYFGVFNG